MTQNTWETLKASGAVGAAGGNTGDLTNLGHRGIVLVIDNTAESGTSPTVTVTIEGKSAIGDYYTILASTALAAQAVTTLTVYPGITAAANTAASTVLPRVFRVAWAIGGTDTPTVTFSVSANRII